MTLLTARASEVGRIRVCPRSIETHHEDGREILHVDPVNEDGILGTAVHALAAAHVERALHGGPAPNARALLEGYRLNPAQVEDGLMLGSAAAAIVQAEIVRGGEPHAEVYMEHEGEVVRLTGTCDLVVVDGKSLRIHDFKTGRATGDFRDQIRAYPFLASQWAPDVDDIEVSLDWLRSRRSDPVIFTRQELAEWFAGVERDVANGLKRFSQGPHCAKCTRRGDCHGFDWWIGKAIVSASPHNDEGALTLTDEVARLDLLDALEAYRDELRGRVKRWIMENGPYDMGDGTEYRINEVAKKPIEPQRAWSTIIDILEGDPESIARVISIRKGALTEEVRSRFPPKERAGAVKALMQHLEDIGAIIELEPTRQLVRRPVGSGEDDPRIRELPNG